MRGDLWTSLHQIEGKSGHRPCFSPALLSPLAFLEYSDYGLINIRVVRARESGMCSSAYVWVVWECTCVGCHANVRFKETAGREFKFF
jgi:hypothetical protein